MTTKPKVVYADYLLDMLDAKTKAAVIARTHAEPTEAMLAAPVSGRVLWRVVEAHADAVSALSKRISALEKAGGA